MDRTLRDPLTGLGNRVALMEELEQLGDAAARTRPSRCSISTASNPSTPASAMRAATNSHRRRRTADEAIRQARAKVFRVGGDSFARSVRGRRRQPAAIGADLSKSVRRAVSRIRAADSSRPPASGIAPGAMRDDPLDLLKNAELALLQAKRQGGGCARLYSRDLEALGAGRCGGARSRSAPRARGRAVRYLLSADRPPVGRNASPGSRRCCAGTIPTKGLVAPVGFHRPFRGDRIDRRAGPLRAGTRRRAIIAQLAALFSARSAAVRQRQCFAPPVARCRFRGFPARAASRTARSRPAR